LASYLFNYQTDSVALRVGGSRTPYQLT
jgi:hypothetical protein